MRCHHCGATIDAGALACPFCKTQTAFGAETQRRQEAAAGAQAAWQAQAAAHQRAVRVLELERIASRTLGWSIAGTVLCCLPLGVVGIVHGARGRRLARELGVAFPSRGMAGFIVSIVACVASVTLFVVALISSHYDKESADERIAVLEKRIAPKVASPTLDQPTACALSEIHFLREGWAGHPGYSLETFRCAGKLSPRGSEGAELEDYRFKWGSSSNYTVNVCFKHGAKWYVTEARNGVCSVL